MTIMVLPNQSMMDVVIMATGSLEAANQFCLDNGCCLSDIPVVGTVYQVSNAALALGDGSVLLELAQRGIIIGTLGVQPDYSVRYADEDGTIFADEDGVTQFTTE